MTEDTEPVREERPDGSSRFWWLCIALIALGVGVIIIVWVAAGRNWAVAAAGVVGVVAYLGIQYLGLTNRKWNISDSAEPDNLSLRLAMEVIAMTEYCADVGKTPSAGVLNIATKVDPNVASAQRHPASRFSLDDGDLELLRLAHAELVPIVLPATPQSLRYIRFKKDNLLVPFFGQVQLVRQMMAVSAVSLVVVTIFLRKTNYGGGQVGSNTAAANAAVVIAASALGGAFYALSTANRYIARRNFDPTLTPSYWSRFVLGLAAGIVLALMIPVESSDTAGDGVTASSFAKPLLALLGGYSAEAVRQIMDRLVDALKTLVGRRAEDEIDRTRQEALSTAKQAELQQRSAMLRTVVALDTELGAGASASTRAALDGLYKELGFEASASTS